MCNVQHVTKLSDKTDTSMPRRAAGVTSAKSVAGISTITDVTGSLEQLSFPSDLRALVVRDCSVRDVSLVSHENQEYCRRAKIASEKNSCEPEYYSPIEERGAAPAATAQTGLTRAQIAGKEIEPIVAEMLGADFQRSTSRGILFSQLGIWPQASSLLCRESDGSFPSGANPRVPAAILECKLRSELHDWDWNDITEKLTRVLGIAANTAPAIRGVLALVIPGRNMPLIEDAISLDAFNERGWEFKRSIEENPITTVLIRAEDVLSYAKSVGVRLSRKTKNHLGKICHGAALARN